MNGNFKVGEVCVGQNFINSIERNGQECVVVGGLMDREGINSVTGEYTVRPKYQVKWVDGSVSQVLVHCLRRKQPPSGELSILNMFVVAPPQRTKEIA